MNHAEQFTQRLLKNRKLPRILDDIECIKLCIKDREQSLREAQDNLKKANARYGKALVQLHRDYVTEQQALGHDVSVKHILMTHFLQDKHS